MPDKIAVFETGDINLLTEAQAAKSLSVSLPTLRRWRRAGAGPVFYRIGGRIKYQIKDIEQWLDRRRVDKDA